MATIGAFIVFAAFTGESAGRSFSRDSWDLRYSTRIGWLLAVVGPHFMRSCAARSSSSGTGRSSKSP